MTYYVVYKDSANQWRWRFVASNSRILAASSESYWNKQDCLDAIKIIKGSGGAPVIDG